MVAVRVIYRSRSRTPRAQHDNMILLPTAGRSCCSLTILKTKGRTVLIAISGPRRWCVRFFFHFCLGGGGGGGGGGVGSCVGVGR